MLFRHQRPLGTGLSVLCWPAHHCDRSGVVIGAVLRHEQRMIPMIPLIITTLAALLARIAPASAASVSLDGPGWTLRSANGSIATSAIVPGVAHLDLARAGVIA